MIGVMVSNGNKLLFANDDSWSTIAVNSTRSQGIIQHMASVDMTTAVSGYGLAYCLFKPSAR